MPGYSPQAMPWKANFGYDRTAGEFRTYDIEPGDETNEVVIAYASPLDGEEQMWTWPVAVMADQRMPHLHLMGFGTYALTVRMVGKNFKSPSKKFLVTMNDAGKDTWATLSVSAYPWWRRSLALLARIILGIKISP